MTGKARRGAGRNTSKSSDGAVLGAASGRTPDGSTEETERGRASARRTVEQGHEGDLLFENPVTAAGRAALDAVGRLTQVIASLGDCSLLTLATLAAVSLLTVFNKPSHERGADHAKPFHECAHDRASRTKL
jgi:hypothetical protein